MVYFLLGAILWTARGTAAPAFLSRLPFLASYSDGTDLSLKRLSAAVSWFTAAPHPAGSAAQNGIAADLEGWLQGYGWRTRTDVFEEEVPGIRPGDRPGPLTLRNVVATLPGPGSCSVLLGGHYDTKHLPGQRYLGANDGGSSTALLLELARVLPQIRQQEVGELRIGDCTLGIVFFDGEESRRLDWNEWMVQTGRRDNLYGSRRFTQGLLSQGKTFAGKPIALACIFDMVGHIRQRLSLSSGSHPAGVRLFLESAGQQLGNTWLRSEPGLRMEDDHSPLAAVGIPYVHVIDWSNTREWHQPADTPEIVSAAHLKRLGGAVLRVLGQPVRFLVERGSIPWRP